MAGDCVLKAENLSIGYGRRAILNGLSFEVVRGETVGIVGPNGSGKTTLLRTMLGLLEPLGGRVERRAGLNISYVSQREQIDTLIPVTAIEVVLMGLSARSSALRRVRQTDRQTAMRALGRLGIESLGRDLFRNLSMGQQRRVLLARALATSPDLLVLDEPTAGMDVASETAMLEFFRELNANQGVTILFVTHVLPTVLNVATSMMLMGRDRILQGTVDEVLQEDRLTTLYGVPVHVGYVAGRRTLVVGPQR